VAKANRATKSKRPTNPRTKGQRHDPRKAQPHIDADGFQLVRRGRQKKNRKQKRKETLPKPSNGVDGIHTSVANPRSFTHNEPSGGSSRASQKTQAPEADLTNCLVGDSMVRSVGSYFTKLSPSHKVGRWLTGAGLKRVTEAVSDLRIEKASCPIVTAGGNDLFLRKGRTGFTKPIISLFGEMIGKVKEKSDKFIILGLIPRMHLGREAHSKAIAVNRRLAGLCRSKNVRFLDSWDAFKGQRALFNADGIHFNDAGAEKSSMLIDARLPKSLGSPSNG
jgi:hypothetical protein